RRAAIVETGVRAGVTRGTGGDDVDEQRVAIAIDFDADDALAIAGRRAFVPQLSAAAAPEPGLTCLLRAAQRFFIHPRQHERCAGCRIAHDRGDETIVEIQIEHCVTSRTGMFAAAIAAFASAMVSTRS